MYGSVRIAERNFDMDDLKSACQVVSEELKKHGDFYDAFVASVESVIKEMPSECWSQEVAEKIVNRISGGEVIVRREWNER